MRKIGLEKWIDQQLNPNSIDDSALDARLERYPTLKMSSDKLVEKFPQPNQAAKKEGISKEEYQQRQREKAREAVDKIDPPIPTPPPPSNSPKSSAPPRIVAELSMAKLDRAIYSNRQLEAVMEDFWFNHFNVFAGKDARSLAAHRLRPRHHSPAHDGQISGSAHQHSEKSRDARLSR